jgi:hypothetical protein
MGVIKMGTKIETYSPVVTQHKSILDAAKKVIVEAAKTIARPAYATKPPMVDRFAVIDTNREEYKA